MSMHGPGMQPMRPPKPPQFRDWAVAPGDRVQHFYVQGSAAMTHSLCNKPCIVGSLKSHAGFGFCKSCWRRKPKYDSWALEQRA